MGSRVMAIKFPGDLEILNTSQGSGEGGSHPIIFFQIVFLSYLTTDKNNL